MKFTTITKCIAFIALLLTFTSCSPSGETTEKPQSLTFETIEKGTPIEDARKLLAANYSEHKVGEQPDIDVMVFEDGRQLVFVDDVLDSKNEATELEKVMKTKSE